MNKKAKLLKRVNDLEHDMGFRNPRSGVAVLVFDKDDRLLMIKRNSRQSAGRGTWGTPGGYIGYKEHFFKAAKRELFEETGLLIDDFNLLTVTSDMFDDYHCHTIWVTTRLTYVNPPLKLDFEEVGDFKWVKIDKLPKNLFLSFSNLIKSNYWKTLVK